MPADLGLMEEVYAFARARAVERTQGTGLDVDDRRVLTSQLRRLQEYYAMAKHEGTNEIIAAAIDIFRKAAMRDRDHRDYDPLWTLPG